jgi:protein gp37
MGTNSNISWCDSTFNPWSGCTKVSDGCKNCYAETLMDTRYHMVKWGKGNPRVRTSAANWKLPIKWNARKPGHVFAECPGCHQRSVYNADGMPCGTPFGAINCCPEAPKQVRPRVFCGSLCDWLDDEVPIEWLADLLDLIRKTPNLDWLLLTKRPENFKPRLSEILELMGNHLTVEEAFLRVFIMLMLEGWSSSAYVATPIGRENYWIGTTVENQEMADERIPILLSIQAKVRFLSCEPLLGLVNLNVPVMRGTTFIVGDEGGHEYVGSKRQMLSWCIAGGESGPKARTMHPNWARSLRDQCKSAGVPFFFKQWDGTRNDILDGQQHHEFPL